MAAENRSNSLVRWMLESPAKRLGHGLVLPLGLMAVLIAALVWNPHSQSDTVLFDPQRGRVVDQPLIDEQTGKEITQRRLKVVYWEKWSGFEGEAIKDAVDCFNGKQDKIYVELVAFGDISQKVRVATAGGNPPDIAGLYSFDVPVFAAQNALIPLDELIARMPESERIGPDTYVHAFWRLCVYNGRVWALPTAPSTWALHWNKKLFREAGLDPARPPRTIKELDEYAEKLTKRDKDGRITQIGFLPTEPGWWKYAWGFWFGGDLWNGKDRLTANSPENVAGLAWARSYADKYGCDELTRFKNTFGDFSSAGNAFFTGKVAMEIQGVWMARFIQRFAPADFEWGAAPFPSHVAGLENVAGAEADVIAIPRGARHPEAAFEFIKFMATPEGMEILCRGHGKNSPLRKTSPNWIKDHPNKAIKVFMDLAESPNCRRTPPIGIWREYRDAWALAFDDVWAGKKTPQQALDELQERMQARLDQEVRRPASGEEQGSDRVDAPREN